MSDLKKSQPLSNLESASPGESLARIVRNSAFNAAGTALILPFNFVALFTLARRLGKESLGTFFTIFAISAVIHWIADMGVATVLTHRVARSPHQLRRIIGEATGMLLVVSFTSVSLFYLLTSVWMLASGQPIPWLVLFVAAVSMISRHTLDFAANAFRGLERFEFENLSRVLQTSLFCVFVWIGVYPETGGILAGFVAFMASNIIAAALIVVILLSQWHCAGLSLSPSVIRDWLRESVPLGFGDAVRRLTMQLDTLLLAAFRPAAAVGLFSVAFRPLQPLQLLPRAIVSVTFPMMSRIAHSDRAALSRAFAQTTNLLWVASLPICLLTVAFAEPLILSTAGPDFVEAIQPLQLLIWVAPLLFISAQLRFAFTALDAQQRYWRMICGMLAIKVIAELILIPTLGIYGACLGHVIGEFVLCAAGLVILSRLGVHGPPAWQLMKVIPAAIAMLAILFPVWQSNASLVWGLFFVPVSLVAYFALCVAFGAWPRSEVVQVWNVAVRSRLRRRSAKAETPIPRSELAAEGGPG